MGFVLMWIVTGNLNVLPFGLLPVAVPWSVVEVILAALIAQRIMGPSVFLFLPDRFGGHCPTRKGHHPEDATVCTACARMLTEPAE
jgi:hypothetical protein